MSQIDKELLEEALGLLAELIEDQEPQHYVVCGGSSLLALGLIRRTTTKDVDVLASLEDGNLVTARPLPEWLFKAVRQASKDFGLMENWFNTDELLAAARWTRSQDPSEGFRFVLGEVLKSMGHERLIDQL